MVLLPVSERYLASFRKFGLSGKSFIPIMIGTGCGVPGAMASRTIENERDDSSMLASIGSLISWIFIPLGWGDWKMAVSAITGLIAKENVVGTFGIGAAAAVLVVIGFLYLLFRPYAESKTLRVNMNASDSNGAWH